MNDIANIDKIEAIMRQQRNSLAVLQALENEADVSLEKYTPEGYLVDCSKGSIINGFGNSQEFIGNNIDSIYPGTGKNRTVRIRKAIASNSRKEYEDEIIEKAKSKWISSSYIPVSDDLGKPFLVLVLSKDITLNKNTDTIAAKKEDQFKISIEEAAVGMAIVNREGKVMAVNYAACKLFSYSEEEFLSLSFTDITHPSDLEVSIKQFNRCITERRPLQFEKRYITMHGDIINALTSIGPVFDNKGELKYLFALLQDITQLKRTEEALRSSEAALNEAQEIANIGSFYWDKKTDKITWSKQMFEISGISPEEFGGKLKGVLEEFIHPDDVESTTSQVNEMVVQGRSWPIEFRVVRPDGELRWIRSGSRIILNDKGETIASVGVNQDITDQKLSEEQIKASLKEKETLLQEIHHRVKNNMQVISSLLKLQAGKIEDQKLKEAFLESQSRINSMSIVHEILHESHSLSKIKIEPYLQSIGRSLAQSYKMKDANVTLAITADDVELSIEQANPIGLILNELVSNAYKYAFNAQVSGLVRIELKKKDEVSLELVVKDNGKGMPIDFDWRNTDSLGLQLVLTLVENQLDGYIHYEFDQGSKFTIMFEIKEY